MCQGKPENRLAGVAAQAGATAAPAANTAEPEVPLAE